MTNYLLSLIKASLPEETWPWVLAALRQDTLTWQKITQPEFETLLQLKLNARPLIHPEDWCPGTFALLALDFPLLPDQLRSQSEFIPDPEIIAQANETIDSFPRESQLFNLEQAGLIALALQQEHNQNNDIAIVYSRMLSINKEYWPTILACLVSILPAPDHKLAMLLQVSQQTFWIDAVIHAFLSNPRSPEKQAEFFKDYLAGENRNISSGQLYRIFNTLRQKRHQLASAVAQLWIADSPDPLTRGDLSTNHEDVYNDTLSKLIPIAKIQHLGSKNKEALATLRVAQENLKNAYIALRNTWLETTSQSGSIDVEEFTNIGNFALPLRNPAHLQMENHPDLAFALLEAGQQNDLINDLTGAEFDNQDPVLLYVRSKQALDHENLDLSKRYARLAFTELQKGYASRMPTSYPPTSLLLQRLTSLFLNLNDPAEASQAASLAIALQPNNVELLVLQGQALEMAHNHEQASTVFQWASLLEPDRIDLRRHLADSLEAKGDWGSAFKERSHILSQTTDLGLTDLHALANCALRAGQPQRAAEISQQALEIQSDDGIALACLGSALSALGNHTAALSNLSQAVILSPERSETWLALAQVQKQTGQAEAAFDTLKTAVQALPTSGILKLALGKYYLDLANLTQALEQFQSAATLDPLSPEVLMELGVTYHKLGHIEQARQTLENAYQMDPCNPQLSYAYAQVLLAQDNFSAALIPLENAIQSKPENSIQPYIDYARTVLLLGNPMDAPKAIQALQRAKNIDPQQLEIRVLLAEASELSGEYEEALQLYQHLMESDISSLPEMFSRLALGLGRTAMQQGHYDTAIASLQEAAQADPRNPAIQRTLSDAFLSAHLPEESLRAAKTALTLAPEDSRNLLWLANQAKRLHELSLQSGGSTRFADSSSTRQFLNEIIQAMKQALQTGQQEAAMLLELGDIQKTIGDPNAAQDSFRQVALLDKAECMYLQKAAQKLYSIRDYEGALSCLERAVCQAEETFGMIPRDILLELASTYQKSGHLAAAHKIIDRALHLYPHQPDLYQRKAEILIADNRPQDALHSLDEALLRSPDVLSGIRLHLTAARVSRMLGDLRTSLNHAEIGLTFLRNNHDSIGHEASILKVNFVSFIAEIYQALLQPERAQQILVDNPVNLEGDTSSFSDAFCLQAELQLEEQEKINPDSKFYDYCEKTKDQIRPLLIQARLRARANDFHGALAVFQSALSHLLDSEQSHLDPNSSCLSSSTYNAIVDSALELYQWNAALEWSQKAIKTAPNEPLPHLLLVKALILRSEFHLLSQQLDVIRNLPPQNDLPEPDQTIFNQEITRVDQLLQQCPDTNDVGSDNDRTNLINPTFCRWQARGKSIFGQTSEISQGIKTLSELIEHHKIQVSRHTPGDVAAQMNALMRMHGNGKDNSRLSTAIQVAQKFHNYPLVMLHLSCALIDRHPQEALRAAQMAKSLTYDSEHPIALLANYLLARLAHQVGETTLATQAIEAAISVWPDEPRWHALAADIYKAAGNVSLAIPHLEEAVRFESRHVPYHIALGNAYLTSAAQDGLAIKRAIRAFERACKLAPDLIDPWIELAQSQRSAGDLAAADATIDQTIQAFPENITPLILKAEISLNQNMPQEAQDYIHKALNIDPDHPSALLVQARLMRNQNRVNEAIKILERAILRAEDPIPLHIERSKLLFITKGADAAIDSLRDVLDHNPNHVDILEQWSLLQAEIGENELAINSAKRALQAGKNNLDPTRLANLHGLIGRLLRIVGQLDQAIYHLTEATHLAPHVIEPYLELGRAHQERRQYRQALQIYRQATQIAPDDPRPHFQAGLALKEGKDYRGAESMLRRAATLAPSDVNIRRQLAAIAALNLVHNPRTGGKITETP